MIPKNRQNNVYGHGEVRALDALLEAAERDYVFDTNLSVVVSTPSTLDNRIHLERGDSIEFEVSENMESVQWRSNHLRDDWSNIYSFNSGDTSGELSIIDIISQIEHLPGIAVMGNHTISFVAYNTRAIPSSSPLVTAEIMVMDDSKNPIASASSDGFSSGTIVLDFNRWGCTFPLALLLVSLISNREEGALAGKDLRTYLDAQILDAVDSDLF